MTLFLSILSINFEIWEWNSFSNLSNYNTNLFSSHYLISFKEVIFFNIKFSKNWKVKIWNLTWVDKKLSLSWKERVLSLLHMRWLFDLAIKFVFRFINWKVDMLFRQIKSWWIDTVINYTSQQFLSDSIWFKIFVKMIKMNKSNKYFQEFDHYTVFKDLDNFSIDKSSRTNILIELNFR